MPAESADPGAGSVDPRHHPAIAFADADWDWFLARCATLDLPPMAEHRSTIEALYGHMVGVNTWLNLTRITEPRDYLKLHLLDSLTMFYDRRLCHLREGAPIVDLGSGGGYPGLPMALVQPRHQWVLVDKRQRKVAFLQAALQLLPEARHSEARHFVGKEVRTAASDLWRRCQLVISRAVGPVDRLLRECKDLLAKNGHLVVAKGPAYQDEEHAVAEQVARKLGYRFVQVERVCLEEGDPDRQLVCYQRIH